MSRASAKNCRQAALVLILVTLALAWIHGSYSNFVPCYQDCGETFIAQHSVQNYKLYGAKYLLLEDRSTIPDINRRPYLYTHNVNLGAIAFILLHKIGVSSFWGKQLVTLIISGLGLTYLFLTVMFVTRSALISLVVLGLFCADYGEVFLFTLNALRAWHWVALFGLVFHSLRLLRTPQMQRADFLGIGVFAFLSFGVGYEFLAIALSIAVLVAIMTAPSVKRFLLCVGWLSLSVFLVFIARQIQVISVLGSSFWSLDFFYSAVIKLTALAVYFPIPSISEIDAYYQSQNVFRPFAAVAPLDQVFLGIRQHLERITFPSIGVGAVASCALGFFLAAFVVLGWVVGSSRSIPRFLLRERLAFKSRIVDGWTYRAGDWFDVNLTARFYLALSIGALVGIGAFGSVAVSIYLKHQMPLIAAVVLLPKGILITVGLLLTARLHQVGLRIVSAVVVVLFVVDHGATQYQSLQDLRPVPMGWIPEVERREGATFAVSWIPSSIAGFTRNWVIGVQPGLEGRVLDRSNRHQPLFGATDLLEVNVLPTDEIEKHHMLEPDYWLYYATDQKAEVQGNLPGCVRSVGRRLYDDLTIPVVAPQLVRARFADRPEARIVSGELNVTGRSVAAVEFRRGELLIGRVGLQCDARSFIAELPWSDISTPSEVTITMIDLEGHRFPAGSLVSASPQVPDDLPLSVAHSQPSAEVMIELNKTLPIAARGPGFVLFDLRETWGRPSP